MRKGKVAEQAKINTYRRSSGSFSSRAAQGEVTQEQTGQQHWMLSSGTSVRSAESAQQRFQFQRLKKRSVLAVAECLLGRVSNTHGEEPKKGLLCLVPYPLALVSPHPSSLIGRRPTTSWPGLVFSLTVQIKLTRSPMHCDSLVAHLALWIPRSPRLEPA